MINLLKIFARENKANPEKNLLKKIIKDADYFQILSNDYIFNCVGLRNEYIICVET